MTDILGYLGPTGTFTEEAAMEYCKDRDLMLKTYSSIYEVVIALENGDIDEGIVPAENSLEGVVTITLDLLSRESPFKIKGELQCIIRHALLAPQGEKLSNIMEVYSHPQALSQCRHFLQKSLPRASLVNAPSTAGAAEMVSVNGRGKAAVASSRNADLYGLEVLKEDIQDEPGANKTRFFVISSEDAPVTGDDKTSLLISVEDKPGSLYSALGIFASYNLNLTMIASRPIRGELGKYVFFIDVDGHRRDEKVKGALNELQNVSLFVKVLGSYPRNQN